MKRFVVLVTATLIASSVMARSSTVITVPRSNFSETYSDRRVISHPAVLVGWQTGTADRVVRAPNVAVSGLQPSDRTICIFLEHVTGAYSAVARIANPNRGSAIELRLPSTLFANRRGLRDADVALLARASPSARCDSTNPILTASWGPLAADQDLNVLLSLASGSTARIALEKGRAATACQAIDDVLPDARLVRQRFNTICRIAPATDCLAVRRYEVIVEVGDGRNPPVRGTFRRSC